MRAANKVAGQSCGATNSKRQGAPQERSDAAVRPYANDLMRDRNLRDKVQPIIRSADFNDIGELKMRLIEMWGEKRTALHK